MNDTDEIQKSDYELVMAISDGYRMYHDMCQKDNPDLISRHYRGKLNAGENLAYVPDNPSKITEVRCNGTILHAARTNEIPNTEAVGYPKCYVPKVVNGRVVLLVFPRPQNCVKYSVDFVMDTKEFTIDDELLASNDVINCIVDYAVAKLTGGDADGVNTHLKTLINDVTPFPCVVESYY